ncbi:regulatory protein [Paraglaciecola Antarctic JLT virus 2]|nr:regulatory protein [Paraglaciecola Antarctic JLT virus 2]
MKLVSRNNGQLKTNSKIVCDVFGKTHKNVLLSIEAMKCSDKFRALNFKASSYTSPQNKKLSCVDMTRDGFSFLCMGFTGAKAAEWKEKYINAFNEMELGILNIDARMTELSQEKDSLKLYGAKWSAVGREIKARKDLHLIKADQLLSEVQLKLEY